MRSLCLLGAVVLLSSSCGSGEAPTGPTDPPSVAFSATVNGDRWIATGARFWYGEELTEIRGYQEARWGIWLNLHDVSGPGTYPLGPQAASPTPGGYATITKVILGGADLWHSVTGTVTISALSHGGVAGSFEFDAAVSGTPHASILVRNGTFDIRGPSEVQAIVVPVR